MEKVASFCPWGFLNFEATQNQEQTTNIVQETEVVTQARPSRSYAAVLKPKYGRNVDTSSLPTPGRQGEFPTISLIEDEVDKGIEYCSQSLVGRLDMNKLDLDRIRVLVRVHWKPSGFVQVTPLGRAHVIFRFDKVEDFQKTWDQGSWIFDSQILRLVKWTPNFSTEKETQSHAGVWVRFPGLSLECWEVRNLLALGRALRRPIHVDETTAKREMGYYASVYVDLDLSKPVPDKIWVESKKHGVGFWQPVKLGKTPEFCNHCKGVGHSVARCKFLKSALEKDNALHKEKSTVVQNIDKETSIPNAVVDVDLTGMSKQQKKRWRRKNANGASSSGSKDNEVALNVEVGIEQAMEILDDTNSEAIPLENQGGKERDTEEIVIAIDLHSKDLVIEPNAEITSLTNELPYKELVAATSLEIAQDACEIRPEGRLEVVLHGNAETTQVVAVPEQENVVVDVSSSGGVQNSSAQGPEAETEISVGFTIVKKRRTKRLNGKGQCDGTVGNEGAAAQMPVGHWQWSESGHMERRVDQ
ncbi:hypothetical protein IFM89_006251 [Coptis chinensis]|uniref:DUF4283 domain-containing protein n=1 Tax=Coptis chinensis TaxID=261450 RepID=A0A835M954_9MAGN|nr:hypothetical protein IFM89_006251 [Coptis chinensis]